MYTIGNVIYGIPLTPEISKLIDQWEKENSDKWYEDNTGTCGFVTLYHGASPYHVGYCGILLGEFDECDDIDLDSDRNPFDKKPTLEQIGQVQDLVEALDPEIKEIAPRISRWVIWSTS